MSDNSTPEKSNKTALYVIIAVVILALVAAAIAYANNNNKSNSNTSMSSSSSKSQMSSSMMSSSEKVTLVGGAAMYPSKDIIDNVSTAPNLKNLVAAVKAANLVDALKGPGPLTVFGPSDEAFAKLPAGTVESLVKSENKAKLNSILTYHVVPQKLMATDLTNGKKLKTLNGQELTIVVKDGKTYIQGGTADNLAEIETADVLQKNGVAHVIKSVLLPDANTSYVGGAAMLASKDIIDNVSLAPNLTTVVAAVKAANLVDALKGPGPLTVFGPDNDAFAKLPAGTVATLLKPENKAQLSAILTYHVVAGKITTDTLKEGDILKTLNGETLKVSKVGNVIKLIGAKSTATITQGDVLQKNGVAHVVDMVLLPSK